MQAPIDTEAVLLSLHASFTLAAVQRGGQQGRDCVLTLVPGPRAQLHTAVPRHTLSQRPQTRAAPIITGAGVPSM